MGVAIASVLAAACAPSMTASPPAPDPPDPQTSSPLTTAGSVKLPVYPPPVVPDVPPLGAPSDPKPAKPPSSPEARAALDALASICAPAIATKDGQEIVGCACCPPFDLCRPEKGAVPIESDVVYPLEASFDGAFTTPNATERALVFEGCEPHAANYGGTLLVELPDAKDPERRDPLDPKTKLRKPDYRSGVHPTKCSKMKDDRALDRLVCEYGDAHQGTATNAVFVYDFTESDDDAWNILFIATDNTMDGCLSGPSSIPVVAQEVLGTEVKDTNGDGRDDVVVSVQARKGPSIGAFHAACTQVQASGKGTPAPALASQKTFKLVYTQAKDGSFAPTPDTKSSLQWMNTEYERGH